MAIDSRLAGGLFTRKAVVVHENEVGGLARVVLRKVRTLSGEVDRLERLNCRGGRQPFLAARDGPLQRRLERAIDPNPKIEVMVERGLKQENRFHDDHVNVCELVAVCAVLGRGFFGVVRFKVNGTVVAQGRNQLLEHRIEAEAVLVEMPTRINRAEAHRREVQPAVAVDERRGEPRFAQSVRKPIADVTLPAGVDTRYSDDDATCRRNLLAGRPDRVDDGFQGDVPG